MSNRFPLLAVPEKSRPALRHTLQTSLQTFGFVPSPLAAMSASPTATAMFDASSLGMLEREVVISTFANRLTRAPLDEAFAAVAWSEP